MANFNLNDYVQVNERLELFRKDHPTWGLLSDLIIDDGNRIVLKATVTDDAGRIIANGFAEEVRGSTPVNRTSALENAETSAWGRALANLGYEVKKSIASRQEVARVQRMEQEPTQPPPPPPKELGSAKHVGTATEKAQEMGQKLSDIAAKRAQRIHIAAGQAGISEEKLRARIAQINHGEMSAKALNDTQATALLEEIAAYASRTAAATQEEAAADGAQ